MAQLEMLETMYPDALSISAKTGFGVDELCRVVADKCKGGELLLRVQSRQSNGKVQSFLRAHGAIIKETYSDGFVLIDARLGSNQLADLKRLKPAKLEIVES